MPSLAQYRAPEGGTSVALGFFDGCHLGHQAILERNAASGLPSVVFTFRNHPASVVASDRAPALLTTFDEREALLKGSGTEVVWVDFDRPFSLIEPGVFVEEILRSRLGARRVVTGFNYRYGHRAAGNVESLRRHPLEVVTVEPVEVLGDVVSSTRIRNLLAEGQVDQARLLLGRPYRISARVQRGDQRGRQLGTPTANLALPAGKAVPAYGVYAVQVWRGGRAHRAVANLGVRPTVHAGAAPLLEVHLLDFSEDLYGEGLDVDFLDRVRAEKKFSGLDELKAQIHKDIEAVRALPCPN